ncbi:hypothetical protein Hanom_Chr16g01455401 [Helianthus anomalus]
MITEFLVDDFDERSEAVGGAGGVADDGLGMVVKLGVDTDNISGNVSFPRSSDQHLLGSCLNMLPSTFSVHEHPCAFNHQINPQFPALIHVNVL